MKRLVLVLVLVCAPAAAGNPFDGVALVVNGNQYCELLEPAVYDAAAGLLRVTVGACSNDSIFSDNFIIE